MSRIDGITPEKVAPNQLTHKPRTRRKAANARSPLIRLSVWNSGALTPMLLNRTESRRVESAFDGTSIVYLMNRGQPVFVPNSLDEIEKLVAGERA